MITLETINEEIFEELVKMKLPPEQSCFVASNVYSIAEAYVNYQIARPFAIMNDGNVVGFLMMDWDEDERTAGIWRFMITYEQQGKGYGREALRQAIELATKCPNIDMLHLDYVPGNEVAKHLYESFGFFENGCMDGDEIVMVKYIKDPPHVGIMIADEDDLDEMMDIINENSNFNNKIFQNEKKLLKAIQSNEVYRLTIYGDIIAIGLEKNLYIGDKFKQYSEEAHELYYSKLK